MNRLLITTRIDSLVPERLVADVDVVADREAEFSAEEEVLAHEGRIRIGIWVTATGQAA